jgi:hypothetical protein
MKLINQIYRYNFFFAGFFISSGFVSDNVKYYEFFSIA